MDRYRSRAIRDAVTSGAMAALFGFIAAMTTDTWMRAGGVLAATGCVLGVVWAIRGRPSVAPTGAQVHVAYDRLLDEAIHTARTAPMWTVLPLLPGTACIGIGLVLSVHRVSVLPWVEWMLSIIVGIGLVVCWRILWRVRAEHTAELLARREALRDHLAEVQGRPR